MEVVEVVHGEEMRLAGDVLLDPLGVLVEAEALLPVHDGSRPALSKEINKIIKEGLMTMEGKRVEILNKV